MLHLYTSIALTTLWAGVSAQTTAFTDAATGITFQQFTSEEGFSFGIVLPDSGEDGFIGRISARTKGGAAVMAGSKEHGVMIVAWPNGEDVVSSLRTTDESFGLDATIATIPAGTSASETGFTYTFLCGKCAVPSSTLGYIVSDTVLLDPSVEISDLDLMSGNGNFEVDVAAAKSAGYAEWATLARDEKYALEVTDDQLETRALGKIKCAGTGCTGSSIAYRKREAEAGRPVGGGGWSVAYKKRETEAARKRFSGGAWSILYHRNAQPEPEAGRPIRAGGCSIANKKREADAAKKPVNG
ncbi:hypothetical protein NX059_010644 [Plenodomus lindquistii]|nr:hypothetical protein NX059_010644 [Plenodomus lindquistii]